ncbi:phosphate propanoyltransferase [Alkaliphilus serpentinus]|uniref:Phosphate propanoyltransferase n=1 Tax=Alkaliphilus serpentinus TaxID=1482731 RepID=A0A833HLB6_9FIRM|nr:phosphate propanoyltransferase [Alkaliphilus serpentinus]KAB3525621.1 phosphate propanoyltransferase [Alkaliphilus serpentinus]
MNVDLILKKVMKKIEEDYSIPIEVSARHVHLSKDHIEKLFGKEYSLTIKKNLSQPGQYQYQERVNLIGPKGVITGVTILGPARDKTQVEVSRTDAIKLGIKPPVRESGDLKDSETIVISNEREVVKATESVIIAKRHIHMEPKDAEYFGVRDKQSVGVKLLSNRPVILQDVTVRVDESYKLNMHIDHDEANCAGCEEGVVGLLIV